MVWPAEMRMCDHYTITAATREISCIVGINMTGLSQHALTVDGWHTISKTVTNINIGVLPFVPKLSATIILRHLSVGNTVIWI